MNSTTSENIISKDLVFEKENQDDLYFGKKFFLLIKIHFKILIINHKTI